ncbi:methyltransferase [Anaplasma phagocytophilum]|uniref:methyltransferase n=1 Tax=Anaplasma phagocytophilum TaxID=948 RepID=UPI0005338283|nr:methyltransferase [Anaplasma phagocytophilum]KDB55779.1 hypothetical protein P030_01615 [Anaplasma phagocytophilum str. CRT35]
MRNIFACCSRGMGSILSKISAAIPGVEEIFRLIKQGCLSVRENTSSIRDKTGNLLATNIDLGLYHFYRGSISDAKTRFWLISLVRPRLPEVHYNIGRCHLVLKRFDSAIVSFKKALSLDGNHKEARYYLNKVLSPESITEVPENVVKQYFNYTSEYFVEHWLISKNYRGHEHVRSLVMNFFDDRLSDIRILDLGCGTGVCGQFLKMRDIGSHLTGVDISRRMLDIARQCFVYGKRAYNALVCIGMHEFLRDNTEEFDVIIMTEVLHYFGDLKEILTLVSKALSSTGMVIGLVREAGSSGYQFIKEGDFFCHSSSYISQTVAATGFRLSYMNRCEIYGDKVQGLLFAISKDTEE